MEDVFNQPIVPDSQGGPEPYPPTTNVARQKASSSSGRGGSEDKKQPPAPPQGGWHLHSRDKPIQHAPPWDEVYWLIGCENADGCEDIDSEMHVVVPLCCYPVPAPVRDDASTAGQPHRWCGPHPLGPPSTRDVDPPSTQRITIWNWKKQRKISGNAAPMYQNLSKHLANNPHCAVYSDQDEHLTDAQKLQRPRTVSLINPETGAQRKGACGVLPKNLQKWLEKNPGFVVDDGRKKRKMAYQDAR